MYTIWRCCWRSPSPCGVGFVHVHFRLLFPGCPQTSICSKPQNPNLYCPFSCLAADHVLQALCRFDPRHRPPGQRAEDLPAVKHLVVADGRPGALTIPLLHSSLTVMPYFQLQALLAWECTDRSTTKYTIM